MDGGSPWLGWAMDGASFTPFMAGGSLGPGGVNDCFGPAPLRRKLNGWEAMFH
jgi:hypothetical protein